MRGFDVVSFGEALVDFLPARKGQQVREVRCWYPCVGGAPANVTVNVARLGGRAALVGVTGDDEFGHFLRAELTAEGVDVAGLRHTAEGRTGLGFVSLTQEGERSFTFYRARSAETFLGAKEAKAARRAMTGSAVLHLGTNSLLQPKARKAVLETVAAMKKRGHLISVDPNLRLHLWEKPAVLKALLQRLLPQCSVVKLSDEETRFVTGTADAEKALKRLERWGVPLAIVTQGPRGAVGRFLGQPFSVDAPRVEVVDTTGAGDGFMAGLLFQLTREVRLHGELLGLSLEAVMRAAVKGCEVGSEAVTRLGAVGQRSAAPVLALASIDGPRA